MGKEEKEFNKVFWKDYNPKCKECKKSCKQSWKVTLVKCEMGEKNKEDKNETE